MSSLASLERIRVCDATLAANCSDYHNHADFAQLRAAIAQAVETAAPKPAKAPKAMGALAFWAAHGEAVASIIRRYGPGWKIKAPSGETEVVTLASGLRSCKSQRGTLLKWGKDHRVPAAVYWPGGTLPIGVEVVIDYARDNSAAVYGPSGHSTEWHLAHGYVRNDAGMWVDELGLRASRSHAEAIGEAGAYRKASALETAALSYGPQPDMGMRIAA
jgi:hypothetical protein